MAQKSDLGHCKCTTVEDKCKVRVRGRGARMRGGQGRGAGSKEAREHNAKRTVTFLTVYHVVRWKCQKCFREILNILSLYVNVQNERRVFQAF